MKPETEYTVRLAQEMGRLILRRYGQHNNARKKQDGTNVTDADTEANALALERLARDFPGYGIVSEEEMGTSDRAATWYVDPLDGTSGYIRRTGEFAVHLGLVEDGVPTLGVVYQPLTGRVWHSEQQGTPRTSGARQRAVIHDKHEGALLHAELDSIKLIAGSEGLRLMLIADGHADYRAGNLGGRANTWDLCAPHAILRNRGYRVTDPTGEEIRYSGQRAIDTPYIVADRELNARIRGLSHLLNEAPL